MVNAASRHLLRQPQGFSIELGVFAGRLYINFPEYAPLIKYLQLGDKGDVKVLQSDKQVGVFTKNPVDFLLGWLTLRRKGQDIVYTPMGYIRQGRRLYEGHPFFAQWSG